MTAEQIEEMEALVGKLTDEPLSQLVRLLANQAITEAKRKLLHDINAARPVACNHVYADFDDQGRVAPLDKTGKIMIQGKTSVRCKHCQQPPKSSVDCAHAWRDCSDLRGSRCAKCDAKPQRQALRG
jgi:hypothetical protein